MEFIVPLHPTAKDWPLSGALAPHLPAFIEKRRLGRYAICTTEHYVEPGHHTPLRGRDLAMNERALARLQESEEKLPRFRASDSLLEFLETL